ncbi:MAG: hypothetical protein EOM25_04305 [Deltaproteobacteria bacterium]|nr:hypothetical protein [Deltaproteobacteria bacterium]
MEFTQREVVLVEEGVCPFCTGMLKEKIMPGGGLFKCCEPCSALFVIKEEERCEMGKSKKGGWPRGIPRQPSTPEEDNLVEAWRLAKAAGAEVYNANDVIAWARENGSTLPFPKQKPTKPKPELRKTKEIPVAALVPPPAAPREGGMSWKEQFAQLALVCILKTVELLEEADD